MMRSGKDYVGGTPEYEDKRAAHLRELLQTIRAQGAPAEVEETAPAEPEGRPAAKSTNQSKPTLKLTK